MRTNIVLPVFFVVFIQLLSILVLLPSRIANNAILEESAVLSAWYGSEAADLTIASANDAYRTVFLDTGFAEWGADRFQAVPAHENKLSQRISSMLTPIMSWMGDRFHTFLNMAYLVIMRSLELALWLPWMLCLLVPALIDGAMGRKIAQTDYDYVSPVRQHAALSAMKASLLGTFVLFFLPLPLNPLFVPAALFCTAVSTGFAMRNIHKRV